VINPCIDTTIKEVQIDPLETFQEYSTTSDAEYTFVDETSYNLGTVDFCGSIEKTFLIGGQTTSYFYFDTKGRIFFDAAQNEIAAGRYTVQILFEWTQLRNKQASLYFYATCFESKAPPIPDIAYNYGDPAL
jgi:hypothetical protein